MVRADAELVVAFRAARRRRDPVAGRPLRRAGVPHRVRAALGRRDDSRDVGGRSHGAHVPPGVAQRRGVRAGSRVRALVGEPGRPSRRREGFRGRGRRPAQALDVDELLADRSAWTDPPADVADRVVAAILAEAPSSPAELYTAADLRAAAGSRTRQHLGPTVRARRDRRARCCSCSASWCSARSAVRMSRPGDDDRTAPDRPAARRERHDRGRSPPRPACGSCSTRRRCPTSAPAWYEGWVQLDDGSIRSGWVVLPAADGVELTAAVDVAVADQFLVVLPTTIRRPSPTPTSSSARPSPEAPSIDVCVGIVVRQVDETATQTWIGGVPLVDQRAVGQRRATARRISSATIVAPRCCS